MSTLYRGLRPWELEPQSWTSGFKYPSPGLGNQDYTLNTQEIAAAIGCRDRWAEWNDLVDKHAALYVNPEPFRDLADNFLTRYAGYSSNLIYIGGRLSEEEQREDFQKYGLAKADRDLAGILPKDKLHEFLSEAVFQIDKRLMAALADCVEHRPERLVTFQKGLAAHPG